MRPVRDPAEEDRPRGPGHDLLPPLPTTLKKHFLSRVTPVTVSTLWCIKFRPATRRRILMTVRNWIGVSEGGSVSRSKLLALLVLTLLSGGVTHALAAESGAAVLADETVDIVDNDYQPGSVTIKAGDTITWTQSGDEPHTVTADDGSFDSGEMEKGETFSMRFDSPGTYSYHCTIHGGPGSATSLPGCVPSE